jgi:hypothetical protein
LLIIQIKTSKVNFTSNFIDLEEDVHIVHHHQALPLIVNVLEGISFSLLNIDEDVIKTKKSRRNTEKDRILLRAVVHRIVAVKVDLRQSKKVKEIEKIGKDNIQLSKTIMINDSDDL